MTRKRGQASRDGYGRTQRQLRVGEELRHGLVAVLARGDIRDPELEGVSVTVTEVRVSPDLKNATAFVMPLGGDNVEAVAKALNRAAPFIRRMLAERITMRYLPQVTFIVDRAFEHGHAIDRLLHSDRVAADLARDDDDDASGSGDAV